MRGRDRDPGDRAVGGGGMMPDIPEARYRVPSKVLRRRLDAGAAVEIVSIWQEFDAWLVRYAELHGLSVKIAWIFAPGVVCPTCRLPLVSWNDKDFKELRCPNYPQCGYYMRDRNEPDQHVASVLAEQRREQRQEMHMPKRMPAFITEREPEMKTAREKREAKQRRAGQKKTIEKN